MSHGTRKGYQHLSVIGAALLFALGCTSSSNDANPTQDTTAPTKPAPAWFEVRTGSGIDFVLHSGTTTGECYLPEIVCGGVGLIDYDADGDLDVFLVQGGSPNDNTASDRLYRNRGDATFEDVTESAGLIENAYGMGCAVGDYDGDGDQDIYVTNVGPNVLWRNDGGRFTNVSTESGVADPSFSASAAFADYDRDGDLDLFVTNYVRWNRNAEITCRHGDGRPDYCQPNNYNAPATDRLYRNNGDGSFRDVTQESGIGAVFGNGLGVVVGDYDNDGSTDFYVANDAMSNQLWLQTSPGKFEDKAIPRGVAVNASGKKEAGMGIVSFDWGADGDQDLFLSHLSQETNTFYENQGTYFEDNTNPLGLGMTSKSDTGFGIGLGDFDLDGSLDLYIANGRVQRTNTLSGQSDPYAQPNRLYRGAGARFDGVEPIGGTAEPVVFTSRGAVFGDLDGDADLDGVIQNRDASITLLINRWASKDRHGLILDLRTEDGRIAVGSKTRLKRDGGWTEWRVSDPASGYCSSQDPRVHFGLGARPTAEEIQVLWPNGSTKTYGPLKSGTHTLTPSLGR